MTAQQEVELRVGEIVNDYQVEGRLGGGAFGTVYAAVHPMIGKRAAIKVLKPMFAQNAEMVSRFAAEARVVNQIRHRNIIDVFAFGQLDSGQHYFVMELLDGKPFDTYLKEHGALDPPVALNILREVARALSAAHDVGVAHRDLKPANIFLSFDADGTIFPKLLDFGIAKLMGDESAAHRTRAGTPMGTPLYMSPEQCRGGEIDHRTDIYAFGVMCHEALAGRRPFKGGSAMDAMMQQMGEAPPPLSSHRAGLPAAVDRAILKMLEKEPADRPVSMRKAFDAFEAAFDVVAQAETVAPITFAPGAASSAGSSSNASAAAAHSLIGQSPALAPRAGAAMDTAAFLSAQQEAAGHGPGAAHAGDRHSRPQPTQPGSPYDHQPYHHGSQTGPQPTHLSAPTQAADPSVQSAGGPAPRHSGAPQPAPPHTMAMGTGPTLPSEQASPAGRYSTAPVSSGSQMLVAGDASAHASVTGMDAAMTAARYEERRSPWLLLLAGMGLGVLVVFGGLLYLGSEEEETQRPTIIIAPHNAATTVKTVLVAPEDDGSAPPEDDVAAPPPAPVPIRPPPPPAPVPIRPPPPPAPPPPPPPVNHDGCAAAGQPCVCGNTGWQGLCSTGPHKSGLYCRCD